MFDIIFQESYAEWFIPLTILIMWILSLGIVSLSRPVNTQNHFQNFKKENILHITTVNDEPSPCFSLQLIKTVRRKVCPDDGDAHVNLLFN
ncbi:MAG TPA: hypothetical protein DEO65_19100 [Bacillus bacterium]|nr:hypothetical protein [Bacillus sp. (in: firmicutes)]